MRRGFYGRPAVSSMPFGLSGKVFDRTDKRLAEDVAESVPGVKNVQNNLRTDKSWDTDTTATKPATMAKTV